MSEHAHKVRATGVDVDTTLAAGEGWHELQVRWLVTRELMGSETSVVGYSVFPPGAKHDLHRHPNAEEWEFVLEGSGIKHVDGTDVPIAAGDLVFTTRGSYHGVANVSGATLRTIWGYTGVGSLDEAGYELPSSPSAWPAEGPS